MRCGLILLLLLAGVLNGCLFRRSPPTLTEEQRAQLLAQPINAPTGTAPGMIVTPDFRVVGQVTTVNVPGQFVVLSFPIGQLPRRDQVLLVYRRGLKVGEVRVTGPFEDYSTVADIVSGEVQAGDEVRDR
jgi:hypothetical protein